ncbi:hypothetical protein BGZ52_012666 [Haplosporangium bisporale]|nr:hypothetical protein BGZ52_012666 [Haplosporangium bisporale]
MVDVSHEWLQDMGLGNPGTKLLCHPMYKQLVLNGVIFDYIPACGLPTGFMDETMQDQTQSQGKQPLVSAQNGTEVQNYYSVDDEPVAHVMADKFSLINTDCGTSSTKAIIKHSSTATLVGNRVSSPSSTKAADVVTESVITMDQDIATDPSSATIQEAATTTSISTNNTNETDSIIQSSKPAPSVRATHIIELSDDEDDLEVTTVIPIICKEEWVMEMQAGEIVGAYVQILLCLAWTLRIHKSKGQNLNEPSIFGTLLFNPPWQVCRWQNFNPAKVTVHPKVLEFTKELERHRTN